MPTLVRLVPDRWSIMVVSVQSHDKDFVLFLSPSDAVNVTSKRPLFMCLFLGVGMRDDPLLFSIGEVSGGHSW